jgi:uncharacterized DUF497 family protein
MFKAIVDMPEDFSVSVQTTSNRGFTPEEVAERCVDRLISVSDQAHPAIRDQANAYRKHMLAVVAFYMREAIKVIELRYITPYLRQVMQNLPNK